MTTILELSPKVGDRVEFLLDGKTYQADVVRDDSQSDKELPYLLGWKQGEELPTFGDKANYNGGYIHLWWCRGKTLVATRILSIGGMTCVGRHCGAYNEYAVPNQPNGTYMCYQCRQRPDFLREPK